jgi:ADP-ribose pyrophosphatase YjhB (NUDIX family)
MLNVANPPRIPKGRDKPFTVQVGEEFMEDRWLQWAKQLEAIASTGMHFSVQPYDRERYEQVSTIARQMLAAIGQVPITRINDLVPDFAQGYATPQVDVRGAVFSGDRILLVRERSDGLWTLPGGYADVGLSAAENIEKEVNEEANLSVKASRLYALRHKAKHRYKPDTRDFYKFFFFCEQIDDRLPGPGPETLAAEFFSLEKVPALSRGRVILADIEAAFLHRNDPLCVTLFD